MKTLVMSLTVALALGALAARSIEAGLPAGRATGSFTVDGKAFSFAHAYAQMEPWDGTEYLVVLLTEKPVSATFLDGTQSLRDVLHAAKVSGLVFLADEKNVPADWRWVHPSLSIGCGSCSDLRLKVASRNADLLQGSVSTAKPQSWQEQRYEFQATFDARIRKPAPGSPAQEAARKKLGQMGLWFTPDHFFASATKPAAVALFLQAGMAPDTVPAGRSETLLMEVAGSECATRSAREVASMLVKAGADVNLRNAEGMTPLVRAHACADLLGLLLDAGADGTRPSRIAGRTVLQGVMADAIAFEKADVVRLLIRRGYDVKGDGPRLLEAARGSAEMEQILREAGAVPPARSAVRRPSRRQSTGEGAGQAAAEPAAPRVPRTPEQARAELAAKGRALGADGLWARLMAFDSNGVLLYLEAGQSANTPRGSQGDTPLLFATSACNLPPSRARARRMALGLIAHGADVNAQGATGITALMNAAGACPADVVQALIKGRADLRAKARGGATALTLAVMGGRAENVKALLDAGYDVRGETVDPLPMAAGKPEIDRLLRAAAK
jgi:ankyrin repeat protein